MKTQQITRKAYMEGDITHEEFYSHITSSLDGKRLFDKAFLSRVRMALKDGDEHLNSIPLAEWDSIADRIRLTISSKLKEAGDFWSMAGGVCAVKQLAKNTVK